MNSKLKTMVYSIKAAIFTRPAFQWFTFEQLNLGRSMTVIKLFTLFVSCVALTGCATSVQVKPDAPTPLVERLALTAHLNLTDEFVDFIYQEDDDERSLSQIDFGLAQVELFNEVFGAMFTLVPEDAADLSITPQVLTVQYNAPRETQLNLYEVFIRYRIKIVDAQQNTVADWVLKGYGKTPTAQFKGAEQAFELATLVALRDVGAQIAIGLPLQEPIKRLIAEKPQNSQSQPNQPNTRSNAGDGAIEAPRQGEQAGV